MSVIAGYTLTETDERDTAVEAFAGMVERARKYDGCLDLSISGDSARPAVLESLTQDRNTTESQTKGKLRKAVSQRQAEKPS